MAGPGSAGCLPEREDGADSRRLRRTRGQRHGERDEVGALGGGNFRSARRRARGRFAVHPFGRQELARAAFGGGTFGEEPPAGSSGIPSGYRGLGGIPGRILGGPDTGREEVNYRHWQAAVLPESRDPRRFQRVGYLLDSGNRSGIGLVGRSPWTAADALAGVYSKAGKDTCKYSCFIDRKSV